MNELRGPARDHVLREIAWQELFPWLMLGRVFRLAIHPALLLVAFFSVIATPLAWRTGALLFQVRSPLALAEAAAEGKEIAPEERVAAEIATRVGRYPATPRPEKRDLISRWNEPANALATSSPMVHVYRQLTVPLWNMYQPRSSWRLFAFYLFGTLATLAIWSLSAGMITRVAVVDLGRDEQTGLMKAFRTTRRRWVEFFTAPLYPVLGTVVIALFSMLVGWLLHVDALVLVAGLLWPLVLLGGVLSAAMLLWLLVGWPLMWPAIAAEETGDAFDAMSRSCSYLTGRPLNYLFYAVVATVLGLVSWTLVDLFFDLILHVTHWSVSWGSGGGRIDQLWWGVGEPTPSAMARAGMVVIRFFEGILRMVSEAFAFSYFWVAASGIYLLMRQDVDHTEFDEIWSDDDAPPQPLPTVPGEASAATPPTVPMAAESDVKRGGDLDNNQAE
jgi:hypothetical protein